LKKVLAKRWIARSLVAIGVTGTILASPGCASISNLNKTTEVVTGSGVENDPNTIPADDSPYARSPRRQAGSGFSLDLFSGNKNEQSGQGSSATMNDPEYAEYLEWKRWQEFKAYQQWKAEQAALKSS
jgi:hypothetical protein